MLICKGIRLGANRQKTRRSSEESCLKEEDVDVKLGYFVSHFPYNLSYDANYFKRYTHGGAETAAYHLSLEMAKKGHKVTVFSTSINAKNSFENYNNMNVYRFATPIRIGRGNFSLGIFIGPIQHDVDLVHAHISTPPADLAGLLDSKIRKIPLVVTYHGDAIESYGTLIRRAIVSFHNNYVLGKILSHARVIICPSRNFAQESRFLGEYADKIVIIPNGVDATKFEIPYSKEECREKLNLPFDEEIILFVGNLIEYKGINVLLRSMLMVVRKVRKTRLVIVGDGKIRRDLENLSVQLGLSKYVNFVGFADENLKPLYYRAADIFVLPSTMRTESFGLVNLEAMACGLPIVASNIGGIPDVVKDYENGLLVPPKDVEALANSVVCLLEDAELRHAMSERGKMSIKSYSWRNNADSTERVYEEILEKN
ncbi:MAG: glycosyltransferase family 4 protein [Candidatus Bathyarchaeota archaeon]|nr:glycosyltransferase family 4 protein [Candidatus Bathyarchaeota archaeon]